MTIKIPPTQAQIIGSIHQSLSAAREYARGLVTDPDVHSSLKNFFNDQSASISILINRMDCKVPKSIYDLYREQVIDADALALDNIRSLFMRMLPAQREMLEQAANGILNGEVEIKASETNFFDAIGGQEF